MTRTVFIATVLICLVFFSKVNYFWKISLIALLLILVFLTGLTRVYLGEHWLSDTLGGGFLGLSAGLFAALVILSSQKGLPSQ